MEENTKKDPLQEEEQLEQDAGGQDETVADEEISTENSAETAEEAIDKRKEVLSWVRMLVIVVAVVIVVTQFIVINARIPSGSMENTIMTSDRLIGFRLAYTFNEPERGDIVLFKYPVNEKETFIKRVIGLPGETVTISNGKIYIDDSDTPLEEDYLPEEWVTENDGFVFQVPEDSYLCLGDNRNNSDDARYWPMDAIMAGVADTQEEAEQYAYVKKSAIKGKAIFIYYKGFKLLTTTADYDE